jgi:hypothetical protein
MSSENNEIQYVNLKNFDPKVTNKKLYIVRRGGDAKVVFFCTQLQEKANGIEVQGFNIQVTKLDKIKATDYDGFVSLAKEEGDAVKNLLIPWHKVDEVMTIGLPVTKKERV